MNTLDYRDMSPWFRKYGDPLNDISSYGAMMKVVWLSVSVPSYIAYEAFYS